MRIPGNKLQALRAQPTVARADIDALAAKAGADPAARAQLALDVLALGARLDHDAAAFARSLLTQPKQSATQVQDPGALVDAFTADATTARTPAQATLLLAAYADRLASLTSDPGARERVAAELLGAASQTAAVGDAARPEGDPWSSVEWTEHAPGWRDTTPWGRLVAILDARGLRPAGLQSDESGGAWWSKLSAPRPLFRGEQLSAIQSGEATLSKEALEASLASLGAGWKPDPLILVEDVKAALKG